MILGMRDVLPDMRVGVEYSASDRWHKSAKTVYDADGRLRLWRPEPPTPPADDTAVAPDAVIGG